LEKDNDHGLNLSAKRSHFRPTRRGIIRSTPLTSSIKPHAVQRPQAISKDR